MKRSVINAAIARAAAMAEAHSFPLPPFASWTTEDWAVQDHTADEIRGAMLGWDVTDFGSGDFERVGLVACTLRNGMADHPLYSKPYAEKLLFSDVGQVTPWHFHWYKMEDIINRGGGVMAVQLRNAAEDEQPDDTDVRVSVNGELRQFPSGSILRLQPGESITLTPRLYHQFWAEESYLMLGEVSMTNDDKTDNRFLEVRPRFPQIEEDEKPLRLLCGEYPAAK